MNIDVILTDLDRTIEQAPKVECDEWCRQAKRRLEASRLIIAHLAGLVADSDPDRKGNQ